MKKRKQIKPQYKVWFNSENVKGGFGDGKWHLLNTIHRLGSLQSACSELNISYRKAWNDLKEAERETGIKLVITNRGGSNGGETNLTSEGLEWLEMYQNFKNDVERAVKDSFEKNILKN